MQYLRMPFEDALDLSKELLPEGQRERLSQDRVDAAERAAKEVKAAVAASSLPFFTPKIQCQCGTWGVRYDRIPHVGGHHQLGKTASLGATDHARTLRAVFQSLSSSS